MRQAEVRQAVSAIARCNRREASHPAARSGCACASADSDCGHGGLPAGKARGGEEGNVTEAEQAKELRCNASRGAGAVAVLVL